MSYSYEQVKPQADEARRIADKFPSTLEARVSNKSIVFCCLDKNVSRSLAMRLNSQFAVEVKAGRNTDRRYIRAFFKDPYSLN